MLAEAMSLRHRVRRKDPARGCTASGLLTAAERLKDVTADMAQLRARLAELLDE
jgi:hypothetical protein